MRWNYAYLIIGLEDQCMGNLNNNEKHICVVAMHVGMVDTYTLFTYPCQMLFDKYDAHLASHNFYISQIGDYLFH